MHVYKVQNVQIGLTASSHWQEIAKYPSVIGWMEARTRSLVDLKKIKMSFSRILQRGAHILREIPTDLTEKFRQIQCTFFLANPECQFLPLGWWYGGCWQDLQYHGDNPTQWWQWQGRGWQFYAFHAVSNCNLTPRHKATFAADFYMVAGDYNADGSYFDEECVLMHFAAFLSEEQL